MKVLRHDYVLAVHNVRESATFYVEKLGFKIVAEPPGWIFVARDDFFMIMLGECPDDMAPSELGCHNYFAYLRVDDADGYYAELRQKAVTILSPLADEPWGMREFSIQTPDGHRVRIGQSISA